MKHLKLLIITIIIIILILLGVLIWLLQEKKEEANTQVNEFDTTIGTGFLQVNKTLQPVTVRNDFYAVKTCVNKFYSAYKNLFNQANSNYALEEEALEFAKKEQEENQNIVYHMLDNEYTQYAGLTNNNIIEKLEKITEVDVEIQNMYVSEQTLNTAAYFVYGNLIENATGNITNFKILVKLDKLNKTFKIMMQDYIDEKYSNIRQGEEIVENIVGESIANEKDNTFDTKSVPDGEYVIDLFNSYKKTILYNRNRAYQLLEPEYAIKRFGTKQNFDNYLQENIQKLVTKSISEYQKSNTENGYTQYICIDNYQNYYIFKETAPMQYTVILDTYTIDLPEFKEKYANSTEEQKVLLNIQKFFEAINHADYRYAYNKLDATYKANNFASLEQFESYVKTNFFAQNKLAASKAEIQGDNYLYNITISDATEQSKNTVTKTFVMQLKEGTDFVMSFSK